MLAEAATTAKAFATKSPTGMAEAVKEGFNALKGQSSSGHAGSGGCG